MRLLLITCLVLGVSACQLPQGNSPYDGHNHFDAPHDCLDESKRNHPRRAMECGGGQP